jgi:RNA 3'-terminal phosphate cyclase-like protein
MDFAECPFRIHVILSTLSGKSLKLKKIRSTDEEPGLADYEVDLLKLIDLVTNGTRVDINETGTSLYYVPGMLIGGKHTHQCKLSRGIGYYLEVLICLAPFMKKPLEINLLGVTNDPVDSSVSI